MNPKIPTPLPLEKWAEFPRLKPRRKLLVGMELREEDLERYWTRVKISGPDECWEWTGYTVQGYGVFGFLHDYIKCHRLAVYLDGREIPPGMFACHSCDNPICVNPAHIWVGTNADNVADRVAKGRTRVDPPKGEKQWRSKLKLNQVMDILMDKRTHKSIAKHYGVCRSNITLIKTGKAWPEAQALILTLQKPEPRTSISEFLSKTPH